MTMSHKEQRELILRYLGGACRGCGISDINLLQIDHIVETCNGGTNTLENLQPLCKACHKRKTRQYLQMPRKKNKDHLITRHLFQPKTKVIVSDGQPKKIIREWY